MTARKPAGKSERPSFLMKPVRIVRTHDKLFIAIALGLAIYLLLPGTIVSGGWKLPTRLLIGWNAGALAYLLLAALKVSRFDLKVARSHAAAADEGAGLVLLLTIAASAASLAAVVAEIGTAKDAEALTRAVNLCLAAATIVLSWCFIQTIFAFHYAHQFYGDRGTHKTGLSFPECKQPEYWDFLYFAFVIGMTFQVSDVQVTSPHVRRTVLLHGIVAFFFNLAVLSLAINIGGSLI